MRGGAGASRPRFFSPELPGYSARVETTPARSQRLLRWTVYAGLWLLLSSTFGSQLYFAGYVQPWLRAAAAEGVYWLSWWVLAPLVFWWCRFLSGLSLARRIPGLLAGAAAALFIVAAIAHLIGQL